MKREVLYKMMHATLNTAVLYLVHLSLNQLGIAFFKRCVYRTDFYKAVNTLLWLFCDLGLFLGNSLFEGSIAYSV